jgi:hypothetical protein
MPSGRRRFARVGSGEAAGSGDPALHFKPRRTLSGAALSGLVGRIRRWRRRSAPQLPSRRSQHRTVADPAVFPDLEQGAGRKIRGIVGKHKRDATVHRRAAGRHRDLRQDVAGEIARAEPQLRAKRTGSAAARATGRNQGHLNPQLRLHRVGSPVHPHTLSAGSPGCQRLRADFFATHGLVFGLVER